ncbi:MFS transporter [Marmoricola endophyticus]|uniref:MFS transporter n=1 Tax=Marmoricola endophyticus TaxID=2040280 RepID=A0A917BLY4_9ACTN|nr:MFS transporter [Marmoricola endophyticus]GGF51329.1 MFS transporter [Marmoricola endophyticus]
MTEQVLATRSRAAGVPRGVLACVCASTLVVMGLVAAVNVAVPALAAGPLHPSASQLLWVVDGHVVVFACLVIPGGALGDRLGRKGVLVAGLVGVAVGAAVTAAAPSTGVLLGGRILTGASAALVLPNCLGVLVHATEGPARLRAIALWGAVSGMGGVVGNTVGGALLLPGSWRLLFVAVVPMALACAAWTALVVTRTGRSDRRLDPVGTLLIVVVTVALLGGIVEGPERGWTSALVGSLLASAAVSLVVWVLVELRVEHPLIDPRLFRLAGVSAAGLGLVVLFFGSFGLFFLNASLLQYVHDFSTLGTGLAILPLAVPLLLLSRVMPTLLPRVGLVAALSVSFVAVSAGLLGLAATVESSYAVYALWLAVVGIGFAFGLPALTVELNTSMPAGQAGAAGGLQSALRELGSALGVAVVGSVLTASLADRLGAVGGVPPSARTVAAALDAAPTQRAEVVHAFARSCASGLWVGAAVTAASGALVVATILRSGRRSQRHGGDDGVAGVRAPVPAGAGDQA